MFYIWLSTFIILSIIELVTINLVTIWFAIGALVTAALSVFIEDITILLFAFCATSLLILLLTRKITKSLSKKETIPTNLDRVIGKVGIVTKEINKLTPGEVKVDSKYWMATSNSKIEKGKEVKIIEITGVKLRVKEIKEEY